MTEAACPGPAGRPGARTAGGVEAISTTRDLSENARPHFEHLQPSSRTPNHSCGYSLHPPPRGRPEVAVHPDRAGLCGSGRPAPERAPSLRVLAAEARFPREDTERHDVAKASRLARASCPDGTASPREQIPDAADSCCPRPAPSGCTRFARLLTGVRDSRRSGLLRTPSQKETSERGRYRCRFVARLLSLRRSLSRADRRPKGPHPGRISRRAPLPPPRPARRSAASSRRPTSLPFAPRPRAPPERSPRARLSGPSLLRRPEARLPRACAGSRTWACSSRKGPAPWTR